MPTLEDEEKSKINSQKEVIEKVNEAISLITKSREYTEQKIKEGDDAILKAAELKTAEKASEILVEIEKFRKEFKDSNDELKKHVYSNKGGDSKNTSQEEEDYIEGFRNFLVNDVRDQGELISKGFKSFEMKKHKNIPGKDIDRYINKKYGDVLLESKQKGYAFSNTIMKSIMVGSFEDGGVFHRPDYAPFRINRVFETTPMNQLSRNQNIGGDILRITVDDDEIGTPSKKREINPVKTETQTQKYAQKSIPLHRKSVKVRISINAIEDLAFDSIGETMRKADEKMTRQENFDAVLGTGSDEARGFLTYPAWTNPDIYQREALEVFLSGSATGFLADNIINLKYTLKDAYANNSNWLMKRLTFPKIITLKDTTGQYLLNPMALAQGAAPTLVGIPVTFGEDIPGVANGNKALILGDFKAGYTIIRKGGMRIVRDEITDTDFVTFTIQWKFGGDITSYEAIKIMQIGV